MGLLSKILRARRRDDRVKIVMIFGAIGITFIILAVNGGVKMYKGINCVADYIVSVKCSSTKLKNNIQELKKIDGVMAAGSISRGNVEIYAGKDTISYESIKLDKTFARELYGIDNTSAGERIYISNGAYLKLKRYIPDIDNGSNSHIKYMSDEVSSSAKLILLDDEHSVSGGNNSEKNKEFVVIIDDGKRTSYNKESENTQNEVLIRFKRYDISGNTVKKLEKKGFTIENEGEELKRKSECDKTILCIKYNLSIGILCMVFVAILLSLICKTDVSVIQS